MKNRYSHLSLITLLSATALLSLPVANAAVLVTWANGTGSGVLPYAPGAPSLASNVTGGTWSFGAGVTPEAFPSGAAIVSANNMNSISFTANDYFEFTLAPAPTYTLDLDTINLGYRGPNSTATLTVRSSLDGFTTDLITPFTPANGTSTAVTLSSTFDNIASSVTFRVYAWNSGGSGAEVGLSNASLTNVVGNVVPEPSSALLFGLGAVVILWRRRA